MAPLRLYFGPFGVCPSTYAFDTMHKNTGSSFHLEEASTVATNRSVAQNIDRTEITL